MKKIIFLFVSFMDFSAVGLQLSYLKLYCTGSCFPHIDDFAVARKCLVFPMHVFKVHLQFCKEGMSSLDNTLQNPYYQHLLMEILTLLYLFVHPIWFPMSLSMTWFNTVVLPLCKGEVLQYVPLLGKVTSCWEPN